MNAANRQSILIIEPNEQLREEIFNLLLSAGYEEVAATASLSTALGKIRQSEYQVTIVDAGKSLAAGLQFAADLAGISPDARIIFMVNAEDQQLWDHSAAQSNKVRFLIKTDYARNLLYLLEEDTQP
jgi:DNA-binding NtrC family response regulator